MAGSAGVLLTVRAGRGCTVVQVDGALDLATAPELKAGLQQAIQDGARHIVLDLASVGFIDSSALGVLVSIYKQLLPRAGRLCLATVRPLVLRVLTLTSVDRLVKTYDSVAAAEDDLAAAGGGASTG
jgi:anti-sigma B factor antagonist